MVTARERKVGTLPRVNYANHVHIKDSRDRLRIIWTEWPKDSRDRLRIVGKEATTTLLGDVRFFF